MSRSGIDLLLIFTTSAISSDGTFSGSSLVTLASAVAAWTPATVRVIDLDCEALLERTPADTIFDSRWDIIGISCYSSFEYLRTMALATEIRRRRPEVCLVAGGYHASARPHDLVGDGLPFDHVVIGDGELPLTRIVNQLAKGERLSQQVLGPEPVTRLDELPPLDWQLVEQYRPLVSELGCELTLNLSRGCVFRCEFCMEAAKGEPSWQAFSPARAVAEIERLDRWAGGPGQRLFLCDPLFGLQADWRREVLDRIEQLELRCPEIWAVSRADLLDEQDLAAFQRAGFGLGFGLESGDPGMLDIIHKGGQPGDYLETFTQVAEIAGRLDLPWGANVIAGHPGETEESLYRSAAFLERLFTGARRLTGFLAVDPYRFYPGSPIDQRLDQYQQRFGTTVHRPRWWDYSEQAFTAMWVDPSASLDFRTRESLTARLFRPILTAIQRDFAFQGPARQTFARSIAEQLEVIQPMPRLATLRSLYLWQGLTGGDDDARQDPEVVTLLQEERASQLAGIETGLGAMPQQLHQAMVEVPRERFVNQELLLASATDAPLPLLEDGSATVSALHAYVINYQLLELQEGDRLLELGGGTGYGAAVAAHIVGCDGLVRSVEIEPRLAAQARLNLAGLDQVEAVATNRTLAEHLRDGFTKVLYCFAINELPATGQRNGEDPVLALLPVGGRVLAPLIERDGTQTLTLLQRTASGWQRSEHGGVLYVADRSVAVA